MSGDVQPRKRKDKKRKKDELSLEEPRGTAAALGEGDVFMHSYHDHGTGGHWCAKIIFFSLLAVLLTLIGLIILENRGLSELEANAVESRYSGVLEGWLEDAPDDDHHDAHTLDLKHHDDDEDDHDAQGLDHDDDEHTEDDDGHDDEHHEDEDDEGHEDEDDEGHEDEDDEGHEDDEDEDHDDEEETGGDDDEEPAESQEQDLEQDEDEGNEDEDQNDEDNDDENEQELEQDELDDENENSELENDDDDNEENDEDENDTQEDEEDEHNEDEKEDEEIEVEKIEQEASDEEPISTDLPALPEDDDDDDHDDDKEETDNDDDDDNHSQEDDVDDVDDADDADDASDDADDDFLEADEPVVERISAPAGKPFVEVEEDETSSEKPTDTLEEEEEYEKQQEELRKEEEQSTSHIWLKLSVGGALLAATHALVRRAAAPRDEAEEEHNTREETPVVDRRMTLIPEEHVLPKKVSQESAKPKPFVEEIVKHVPEILKSTPIVKQESEEEEEIEEPEVIEEEVEEIEEPKIKSKQGKELYSDEEEAEDEEEEVPEQKAPVKTAPEPEADDDVPDDVEIIDEEELEEELEEEEEEVSDVDDTELLSRLEAKYGRLPEPERPGQRHKDGGNSLEDQWPGEPSDAFWRQELDSAEEQLRQGAWTAALERASAAVLRGSARARYVVAAALDRSAEAARDNRLLSRAITAYLELLKMNEHLSDKKLLEVAQRALNRIQFRGNYLSAEPIYRLLIRRFPNEPTYRNNLTISFLMANRVDLAEEVLKETIARWPNDRVALAHYGFVLKTTNNKLEEAIEAFEKALDGDKGPACEPRFYYHYGDALLLLRRYKEAHEVHKRGAKYGHFLSPAQRSLYNVPRLKSKPWWNAYETPYSKLAKALEKSWKEILKEGEAAKALYEKENEGLKERGDWSQMDLFVRGQEIPGRCKGAPVTCSIVKAEVAAAGCRRGQVKFSAMQAGTHVRPHVGPTNCRLRMHLGLSNTKDTYLRVDQETRQWQEGRVLLFDDSFEHEVWHNGTGKRLVLIVDVWHPDLTAAERRSLPAI